VVIILSEKTQAPKMTVETLAKFDDICRGAIVKFFPPKLSTKLYSTGRKQFIKYLTAQVPRSYDVPVELGKTCWGIKFQSPILNAAGMFKNGEGYEVCAAQGAGAYLAGTTTALARAGNFKNGIGLPFAPYPKSHAASNWLGLPNNGDVAVARELSKISKISGCPVGISLMGSPDLEGEEKLKQLVKGLELYAGANVDFIEINESCPNTGEGAPQQSDLRVRLEYLRDNFLIKRSKEKYLPVVVKFSNDTEVAQVGSLIELLVSLGFDGVNFGNTSTNYKLHQNEICEAEKKLYQYFTSTFGGGVSGAPLKRHSLLLVKESKKQLDALIAKGLNLDNKEFHIIRTGGVETAQDLQESLDAGASLVGWFTGYFDQFSKCGHNVYQNLYCELLK
jgi:dihydroorotate dehydrogenase